MLYFSRESGHSSFYQESLIDNQRKIPAMIKNTQQNWKVGSIVSVGFMKGLVVEEIVLTPGDYLPDEYILAAANGVRYSFIPHNGISRLPSVSA